MQFSLKDDDIILDLATQSEEEVDTRAILEIRRAAILNDDFWVGFPKPDIIYNDNLSDEDVSFFQEFRYSAKALGFF